MMIKQWLEWGFESVTGFVWHRKLRRETGEIYMDRWQLLKSKPLCIYVNRINAPDYDDLLHTHPWRKSWSLKLRGSYLEQLPGFVFRRPSRLSRIPDQHKIVRLCNDAPCWTLFIGWRRDAPWGFISHDGVLIPHKVRRQQRGVLDET
jgi:hypothetical protein